MMRKKPMLAYPVSDKPIDYTKPVFMQPKLDGVRCLIQYENRPLKNVDDLSGQLTENVVVAYSRTGKEWLNIDHILQSLKLFFQDNPDVILDGELYNHALRDDFEKIISCVRKTKPTDSDKAESRKLVQFHCYDIVDESKPFLNILFTSSILDFIIAHFSYASSSLNIFIRVISFAASPKASSSSVNSRSL